MNCCHSCCCLSSHSEAYTRLVLWHDMTDSDPECLLLHSEAYTRLVLWHDMTDSDPECLLLHSDVPHSISSGRLLQQPVHLHLVQ